MIIGFTGTRSGLTELQKQNITNLLNNYTHLDITVHHGDCVGADKDFHELCRKLSKDIKIVIHPPNDNKLRAFCDSVYIEKPKSYLKRNKDIVNSSNILIACPYSKTEQFRSGTWSTIRYAKKINMLIYIF